MASDEGFVYLDPDETEESSRYKPGGLCPVKMGDIVGPDISPTRYRILAKAGHGAFSTVWAAYDLIESKTVAVKFVEASQTQESREIAITERLRISSDLKPPPVLQIIDSFTVSSVNGVHQVIITEPVLLLERFLKLPEVHMTVRDLVHQALEGLAFIHGRGIAHGDLHPGNLGVALPELHTLSYSQFLQRHGVPELTPLVACDPARDPASYPPYLSHPIDLARVLLRKSASLNLSTRETHVRILDFGNAYVVGESPSPYYATPYPYAAPEVIFRRVVHDDKNGAWDKQTDIWSLASSIHEIAGGGQLFGLCGVGHSLLRFMASLCGGAPKEWMDYFAAVPAHNPKVPLEYTTQLADAHWSDRTARFMTRGASKEDAEGLIQLLRRMLVIDPEDRPTAAELLQDPYFDEPVVQETPMS